MGEIMSSLQNTQDQSEWNEWGSVEFQIYDQNIGPFINQLISSINLSSPSDRVFQDIKSVITIEGIRDDFGLMENIQNKGETSIEFIGYEVSEGKAKKIENMIHFSVKKVTDSVFHVTGFATQIGWAFFSYLLQDTAENFEESRKGIDEYYNRVRLALETLGEMNEERSNQLSDEEGIKEENIKSRINQPKRDAIRRVAIALFFLETGDIHRISDAAYKFNTTVNTINKYEHHPDVEGYLRSMRADHSYAAKLRQGIGPKRKRNGK